MRIDRHNRSSSWFDPTPYGVVAGKTQLFTPRFRPRDAQTGRAQQIHPFGSVGIGQRQPMVDSRRSRRADVGTGFGWPRKARPETRDGALG